MSGLDFFPTLPEAALSVALFLGYTKDVDRRLS